MVGIYKITSPSEKVYIGQSWNIDNRKYRYERHYCVAQPKLYNSLVKYGWEAHTFEIELELRDDISQDSLDTWEQYFMDKYRGAGFELMNLREAGSCGKHAEETKNKISKINKGRIFGPRSEEVKIKISKSNTGKKRTPEQIRNISKAHIGIQTGTKNGMFGKKHTEEVKAFMRGRTRTPEQIANWKEANIGKHTFNQSLRPILQFTKSSEFIREWSYINEAQKELKISNIWRCCSGGTKTAGGFIWCFKDQ